MPSEHVRGLGMANTEPVDPRKTWNPPVRKEAFDVVVLRNGKSEFDARWEDFRRVTIHAESTLAASGDPQVAQLSKEFGGYVHAVVPMNHLTPAEMMARRREVEPTTIDKSKV